MAKATHIKSIGNVRLNGFGADLYQNPNGSASIRFDKNGHSLPSKHNMVFSSIDLAEEFIESKTSSDPLNTANTLNNILIGAGIFE